MMKDCDSFRIRTVAKTVVDLWLEPWSEKRGALFDRLGPVWGPRRLVMITLCSGSVQNERGIRHSATQPTSTSA